MGGRTSWSTDLANQRYALYQNNGDGTFNYASNTAGIGQMTMAHSGWGVRFFDYDNDGWKDLLIAQGHDLDTIELNYPNLHYREPMLLARNTGHGFVDVSAQSGSVFRQPWVARGLAIGDLDNDGRLDAVVTTNDGLIHVLHNLAQTQNHWLLLKLVGHKSNRDAIGAEVELVTAAGSQFATVSTASSYLSASDKRVHFGLGKENVALRIEIRWPSGIRQTVKRLLRIRFFRSMSPPRRPRHRSHESPPRQIGLFASWVVVLLLGGLRGSAQSTSAQISGAFDRGMAEFRAGNYSSAAVLFADAEAASPGATDALLYQAKSLVHLQDFAGAERALRGYVPSHPELFRRAVYAGIRSEPSEPAR